MPKLTISQLRKIISEEVELIREGDREDQAAKMATAASKLLSAIESFKVAASAKAKSNMDSSGASLEKHLKEAEAMLKRIVASPLQHVDGPKPQVTAVASSDAKSVSVTPSVQKKA